MALNSLRDKLLKAGLVDEKQVEKAEAQDRARRSRRPKGGRPDKPARPRPAEERLTPEELAAAEAKRAEQARRKEIERERQANRERAKRERAIAEDVRKVAEYLGFESPGEEVFFFPDRKGRLQRMLISEALRGQLEAGEAAVVERPMPHAIEFAVVPREGAEAVLKLDLRAVRFYNRAPGETYGPKADPEPEIQATPEAEAE